MEARDLEQVNERLQRRVQGRNPTSEYRKRLGGLRKRYGKAFDPKKADWVISKDLAKEGFSGEQIKEALRQESPALKGLSRDRSESYVNRTVDKVMDLGEVKAHRQEKSQSMEMGLFLGR